MGTYYRHGNHRPILSRLAARTNIGLDDGKTALHLLGTDDSTQSEFFQLRPPYDEAGKASQWIGTFLRLADMCSRYSN